MAQISCSNRIKSFRAIGEKVRPMILMKLIFGYLCDNKWYFNDLMSNISLYIFCVSFVLHWVWFIQQIFCEVYFIAQPEQANSKFPFIPKC